MKLLAVGVAVGLLAGGVGARVGPQLVDEFRSTDSSTTLTPDRGAPTHTAAGRVWLTDRLVTFDAAFRITHEQQGERFDPTNLVCHGGRAQITWHIGNLEPTNPDTGIHVSVLFDGDKVGTLLKGSTRGVYEDGPEEIQTVVPCPPGRHQLAVTVDSIEGEWGFPYANDADVVQRGFIVEEVAR
jgi:hypothetical protein